MSSLYEKQKRKGGVIDLEKERNRFLIDITSVCIIIATADKLTTWAVVKIRPKKKIRPVRDLNPWPFYQALFSLLLKWCTLLRKSLLYSRLYPQFKRMTFIYSQSFIVMSVAFFISGDIINLILLGLQRFQSWITFCYVLILLRLNFVTS